MTLVATHRRHPRPVRPPLGPMATIAVQLTLTCSLLAAWLLFFALGVSSLQAARGQEIAYGVLREQLALATAPLGGGSIEPGSPVALLEAPSIGLRLVVVEGTAPNDLRSGPGHRRDTPLPGQAGVSVIYGRSVTFGGPFRHLPELAAGDTVTATTGQGTFNYRVDGVRRVGDPLPDPVPSGQGRLTMVTSVGGNWRGGWAPNQVLYVDATLVSPTQQAPSGRPLAVPTAETALRGDAESLVAVVLWLQVLLAGALGGVWARSRWGGRQAWLVFVPVVLAALWGASESAIGLLPNLL